VDGEDGQAHAGGEAALSYRTIGSCSLCGGAVRVPLVWMSIFAPTAECADCGALGSGNGPVIPMKQALPVRTYTDAMEKQKRQRLTGG
jgi:hypothetical protein